MRWMPKPIDRQDKTEQSRGKQNDCVLAPIDQVIQASDVRGIQTMEKWIIGAIVITVAAWTITLISMLGV